jgi:hypothetical protein
LHRGAINISGDDVMHPNSFNLRIQSKQGKANVKPGIPGNSSLSLIPLNTVWLMYVYTDGQLFPHQASSYSKGMIHVI